MKEEINLLPVAAKKSRRQGLFGNRFRSLYATIIGVIFVIGLGYLGSYIVLRWTTQDVLQALETEQQNTDDIDQTTRAVNVELGAVHGYLKENVPWIPHVSQALQVAPVGVVVTSVDIAPPSNEEIENVIMISGRAGNRAAIVEYEKQLRELPWALSVGAPLQNFASGPNVTFKFTVKRKL